MNAKHDFALFVPDLNKRLSEGTVGLLNEPELVARISSILRLKPGEEVIFFDGEWQVRAVIRRMQKNSIEIETVAKKRNTVLLPHVTCLLPLLKRDDLESTLYSAVELGASSVQLMVTQKVQRVWGGKKEYERLQRVMIAAAEQSKNFSIPSLHHPLSFSEALQLSATRSATKFCFDVEGQFLALGVQRLFEQKTAEIMVTVGPEGDFTHEEKDELRAAGFIFYTLTPTVLRSASALQVGLGLVRSVAR